MRVIGDASERRGSLPSPASKSNSGLEPELPAEPELASEPRPRSPAPKRSSWSDLPRQAWLALPAASRESVCGPSPCRSKPVGAPGRIPRHRPEGRHLPLAPGHMRAGRKASVRPRPAIPTGAIASEYSWTAARAWVLSVYPASRQWWKESSSPSTGWHANPGNAGPRAR